jgi:hypothetical protein
MDLRLLSFQVLENLPYVGLSLYVGEDTANTSAALPILWILVRKGEAKQRIVDLITSWFREEGLVLLRIATSENPTYTVLPSTSPLAGGDYAPPKAKYARPSAPPPQRTEAENASLALLKAHEQAQKGGLRPPPGPPPSASGPSSSSTASSVAAEATPTRPESPLPPAPVDSTVASTSSAEPADLAARATHSRTPSNSTPTVLGKFMDDIQFNILSQFAKITRTTQSKAVDLLDSHPAARQAVGMLPQNYVARVLPAEEAARIAEDFEPARNYISHFAGDMLSGNKKFDEVEDLPAEASELGDFEVVGIDDLPLEMRNHHRTGQPVSPEEFLTWFDKDGRLEKSEEKIREHVFFSGVDMDIRPVVWPFLLGVYKVG